MTAVHEPDLPAGLPTDVALAGADGSEVAAPFDPVAERTPSLPRRLLQRFPAWAGPVAVGGLALASCVYVGVVDPNSQSSPLFPQCTFKALTGYDCPGCGLTRAMHSIVTGNPVQALDHNIFIVLILPLSIYWYLGWLSRTTIGVRFPKIKVTPAMSYALLIAVLTFWVVRNIPVGPFTWLASTAS